ncbi:hypothetical protein RFI_32836, partial [Reticulomyxa filosa]
KWGWPTWIIVTRLVFLVLEWGDWCTQMMIRYVRFKARRTENLHAIQLGDRHDAADHIDFWYKYYDQHVLRVFIGPGWERFDLHTLLLVLITLNFFLAVFTQTAPFSYYVPLEGVLLVIRSDHIFLALQDFVFAIQKAGDVLLLWFCLLVVVACLGMALFMRTLNTTQSVNNYSQLSRALVTTFVFITTGENYTSLIYGDEQGSVTLVILLYFLIVVVIGLFCLIPMVINRFQQSYQDARVAFEHSLGERKTNALVAAFVMLDIDQNGTISRQEFQNLIRWSPYLSEQEMWDIFNVGQQDDANDDVIDLEEFNNALADTQTSSKIVGSLVMTSRGQAILETWIFRRDRFRHLTLLICVVPAFGVATMYGLSGVSVPVMDAVLILCFILNVVEICVRWYAYGFYRFFDLVSSVISLYSSILFVCLCALTLKKKKKKEYPDPPFIEAAVYKWRIIHRLDDTTIFINLPHHDWKWAMQEKGGLRPTRPW